MIAALFDIVNDVAFHVAGVLLCNADRTQTESTTQTGHRRNQQRRPDADGINQHRPDTDRSANADPTQTDQPTQTRRRQEKESKPILHTSAQLSPT
jgi:hypothetical protein